IQARPITTLQRLWRWYCRHAALVAGAYTILTFATQGVYLIMIFGIIQLFVRRPDARELLSGFGLTAITVPFCLVGVETGVAAFRGKRRGLWIALIAFVLFSVANGWSLYWAIAISREISDVPIHSSQ